MYGVQPTGKSYAIVYMNDRYTISEEINFTDKQLRSLGKNS